MEGIGTRIKVRNMHQLLLLLVQMDAAATFLLVCLLLSGSGGGLLNILGAEAQQQQQQLTNPLQCPRENANGNPCSSYLYIEAELSRSVDEIAALYNIPNKKVFDPPWNSAVKFYLIEVYCQCKAYNDSLSAYFAATFYTVNASDTSLAEISDRHFGGMVFTPVNPPALTPGKPLEIDLLCGCPTPGADESLEKAIVTYNVQQGNTLLHIVNTLHADMTTTLIINSNITPDFLIPGQNIFVPISSKPTAVAGAPTLSGPDGDTQRPSHGKNMVGLIAGCVVAGVVGLLLVAFLITVILHCLRQQQQACSEGSAYNNVLFLGNSRSFRSGRSSELSKSATNRRSKLSSVFSFPCAARGGPRRCSLNNNVKRNITLPREAMSVFDQEKPIVFIYEEIVAATQNFDEGKKLGQGAFGTVYRGTLRHQEVAVKQMKATKSKEFLAELKVLCKVHHTNLIELIGYSSGEDSLFLVYEFAENGSLSDHLHDPVSKGNVPLPWTARVQIALDAARGLEYIHDHTKTHYVHRDVKTRNILLDNYYRGKLADFGLAKLVEHKDGCPDVIKTATLSGTFGYLAPEYVRDGLATSKSDVYAFGVVLFELITGREALSSSKSESSEEKSSQHRHSIISGMLRVLDPEPDDVIRIKKLRSCVDPNLDGNYPFDAASKIAQLGKACIDEVPGNRPDMKQIVFALSQNLLTSIEWEAALAGSSQIFSGLVQGR